MSSGLWTLKEWHTPEEAERLKQERAKASQEHIERTKRGMEEAKKSGRPIGARIFLNEANMALADHMLDEGMKIKDVAAKLGVSASLLHQRGFRRKWK
jgi:DNA invertase Pin-like site-specific DNA recombinase